MHGAPGPVTGLDVEVATGLDANGQPAGRTQLVLSWMAPAATTAGTGGHECRAGHQLPHRLFRQHQDLEEPGRRRERREAALMEAKADSNCAADAADGMRCFTDMTP